MTYCTMQLAHCSLKVLLQKPTENFVQIQDVQLKSGPYFNITNLFNKIYNMLYYTTKLYLH